MNVVGNLTRRAAPGPVRMTDLPGLDRLRAGHRHRSSPWPLVGFTLQFGITNILNLAYGDLMTASAYIGWVGQPITAAASAESLCSPARRLGAIASVLLNSVDLHTVSAPRHKLCSAWGHRDPLGGRHHPELRCWRSAGRYVLHLPVQRRGATVHPLGFDLSTSQLWGTWGSPAWSSSYVICSPTPDAPGQGDAGHRGQPEPGPGPSGIATERVVDAAWLILGVCSAAWPAWCSSSTQPPSRPPAAMGSSS